MSERVLSAEEVAVNRHLQEYAERAAHLQAQIDNLPADRGLNPQLVPGGGPANMGNARHRLALEKQLGEAKEHMLQQVEQEIKDATPGVRDKCNHAVDKVLYPEKMEPSEQKTQDKSAAYMYQKRFEKEPVEQQPEAKDMKTLEQSQDYAYRLRFGDDPAEPTDPGEGVEDIDMDRD